MLREFIGQHNQSAVQRYGCVENALSVVGKMTPVFLGVEDPLVEFDRRGGVADGQIRREQRRGDRKSTRLNSSHANISYAVFCLKKKTKIQYLKSHRVV